MDSQFVIPNDNYIKIPYGQDYYNKLKAVITWNLEYFSKREPQAIAANKTLDW